MSLGDVRKLKTSEGIPLSILVSAGEYLSNKGWFADFRCGPFGERQERLSRFLWNRHKPSLAIESRVFRAIEKIAKEGVEAWNSNPVVDDPRLTLVAAPPCRWTENLDSTCKMMSDLTRLQEDKVKTLLLNF